MNSLNFSLFLAYRLSQIMVLLRMFFIFDVKKKKKKGQTQIRHSYSQTKFCWKGGFVMLGSDRLTTPETPSITPLKLLYVFLGTNN